MTPLSSSVSAEGLAKILFIQSMAHMFPDEKALLDFVCRGLTDMPGVGAVHFVAGDESPGRGQDAEGDPFCFPVVLEGRCFAEILVETDERESFLPYFPHVRNLCFTLAVMLEERRLRRDNESYRKDLEARVEKRTRALREQVHDREIAEKLAMAEKVRAERYLEVAEAITLELDAQGRIEIINKWGAEILGYSPEDLVGRVWVEVAVPPEDRVAVAEQLRRLAAGNIAGFEYAENEILTREGHRRRIAWHNVLRGAPDGKITGILSFGSDITERKGAELSLRLKQRDLDHAQAVARIGNWRLDVRQNELVWSDEAYRIFGVEKGTPLTYGLFLSFVHPEDRDFVNARWTDALAGKPYDIDHRILVEGAVKWVREKAELEFDENGALLGGFGTVQDITDRKQLEADLLDSMRAAEAANSAKSQFLANMSHELRTPLTVIMGALNLLREEVDPRERERLANMADDSAERLLRIISDLLDFATADAGRLKVEAQPFDLRSTVREILAMFDSAARKKGIEFDWQVAAGLPAQIVGDSSRIGQVLINLVGNAVKFTHQGKIEVEVWRQGGNIQFSVSDTGIGIARDKLDQLFQPFTQVDGSLTRLYGGAGLGLAISKELVELMGGRIWAESDPGRGSTFSFSLPLKKSERPEAVEKKPAPEDVEHSLRILVAEDDPMIRHLVQTVLERRGLPVTLAENGREAVILWQEGNFDMIFMDLQMPDMDGLEATRAIRRMEEGGDQKIYIVGLTAHAREEDHEQCLQAGMNDILTKPFRIDDLERLIGDCRRGLSC